MDLAKLKRDPSKVLATFSEINDKTLVTKTGCKIYVPSRFVEHDLASLGAEVYVIGILTIVAEGCYSSMMVCAMIKIDPAETNRVQVDGDEYLEFVFYPGSVVIPNLYLAKTDTLVYKIYDEIIAKAKVPVYLTYFDLAKLFDTARKHAGANVGYYKEVTELLISLSARSSKNRKMYYRQVMLSTHDFITNPPYYASLKDVTLSATNTTNKLSGGYFRNGTISAINTPSERVERLEGLLIK